MFSVLKGRKIKLITLQSKIKGALYGFAIGDAMGATTEFMNEDEIYIKHGKVTDIIGGGWLRLKAGEITDDTEMMLAVCEAIQYIMVQSEGNNMLLQTVDIFLNRCCKNFSDWFNKKPIDVGGTCRRVLSQCQGADFTYWHKVADDPQSLGNGSLMRTLPCILSGYGFGPALLQGRLTHNNRICDMVINSYYSQMESLLYEGKFRNSASWDPHQPTGHVINTYENALYWVQTTDCLEDAIISAVNHGGDADTIAAITGSMAGALYGFEAIPERWIEQLNPFTKIQLDKYSKIFEKVNKKVCTK